MTTSPHPVLSGFHPVVAGWFQERFAAPSAPQERGWPAIRAGQDTLIAAPTGSGKTLAAFLTCIDGLIQQGLAGSLADETQVLYVSPLKALSNDVQKNLAQPLSEIRERLTAAGLPAPEIRVQVRTGDTPGTQRQAMVRRPPHILVTTPESLYILLTSDRGRAMLRPVRTLIIDEIHAVAGSKRGSHLALSVERLQEAAYQRPVRIGLSATQKPIADIARLLTGDPGPAVRCTVVDEGYRRRMDLDLELTGTPLAAVASLDAWDEMYDRLAELVARERTTLIFVNTRRLAERMSFNLAKRLGEDHVTSHHGSLSKEQRLRAEQRLKAGDLKALVATASLELGIDIGSVDLVCQIGSSRAIATLLQRAGRSGHYLGGLPRGRLFPLTRDDLVECTALLQQVRAGRLDRIRVPEQPMDILAQQVVAAVSMDEWDETALYHLVRRAYPYRSLTREAFDGIVAMVSEGFSTNRGRSATYVHRDAVNGRLRARKGARLAAVSSGGAIPDNADYQVVLEPENLMVGTVNEDWAIESMAGDIFQLGASSWRILRVEQGKVRVEDAHGQPPTIPFWLGEAPGRSDELSAAVSDLRREVGARYPDIDGAVGWVMEAAGGCREAALQLVEYVFAGQQSLGVVPTQDTLVLERFFDDSGGMQLVVHSPYGTRVNRAWGLALRKRFCRTFNFELQAAATEDAIVLSLGPQHSFPLEEVFHYLHPNSAQNVLVQALLAAPMFRTRWRWNVSRALAVLRQQNGRRVPMPIQRMRSDDLMAAAFPDAMACAENIVGDIRLPDHPLVQETIKDCLTEAMDVDGFLGILHGIGDGRLRLVARDTTEPSPFAHEILSARPYAFLDDAPLEERRTQAVSMRRGIDLAAANDLGALDPEAILRVRDQVWPEAATADELHDALLVLNALNDAEAPADWRLLFDELQATGRATRLWQPDRPPLWAAAERLPLLRAALPEYRRERELAVPAREAAVLWESEQALRELLRGRLEATGPTTAATLGAALGLEPGVLAPPLAALEAEGFALQGHFTPGLTDTEWCDRRLLARIHRYTLDRLRKEIEPVSPAEFIHFLTGWHHVAPEYRLDGPTGLVAVLETLEGFEIPVSAWEDAVLPARLLHYQPAWLEQLCLSGELAWARLFPPGGEGQRAGATRSTPVSLVFRDHLEQYLGMRPIASEERTGIRGVAREILECLDRRGACFFQELVQRTRHLPVEVEEGLRELVSWGLVTGDGFTGLQSLTSPLRRQPAFRRRQPGRAGLGPRMAQKPIAGRWSALARPATLGEIDSNAVIAHAARALLRRYGVMFPRLLTREAGMPPWRDLVRAYRRLEARGEIRGGRFISGFTGEQYALPEAVEQLRAERRRQPSGALLSISAADPLNLVGIVTPGARVPASPGNRVTYRDGVPVQSVVNGKTTVLRVEPVAALASMA